MTAWGHGFILLGALGLSVAADRREAVVLGLLFLVGVGLLDRRCLAALRRPATLGTLGILLLLGPVLALLTGEAATYRQGLSLAAAMTGRAAVILAAVALFTRNVSFEALSRLLQALGLPEIGFVAGVALNLVGSMGGALGSASEAVRLRGGYRRHPWRNLKRVLVATVIHAARRADEVVLAARVRAYRPGARRSPLPLPRRRDWCVLVGALAAFIWVLT